MPYAKVASIHNEPTDPLPYYERSIMLREFPAEAQDKFVELVGPDSDTTMWIAELRALGGAWDREPAVPNAVATRGLPYVLLGVEVAPLPHEQRLKESIAALLDGMQPWQGDRRLVNNLAPEEAADARAAGGDSSTRLDLADALIHVARLAAPQAPPLASAFYLGGSIDARVRRLVDPEFDAVSPRWPRFAMPAAALVFTALVVLAAPSLHGLMEFAVRLLP